ncbi:hypothetical protein ACIRBX_21190 [Kitasatospora sp. NPDC096147]|uniref:hypothetical protein n=1 Tax=Kitasatospora sp. NPDC096147 TaxID=3364093 RepID=UPI00382E7E60
MSRKHGGTVDGAEDRTTSDGPEPEKAPDDLAPDDLAPGDPDGGDPDGEQEPAQASGTPARARTSRRRRAAGPPWRRPALAALAVVLLAALAWQVPPVRTVLRQSFTQQNAAFTELYFTDTPAFEGATAVVPVALNAHGTGEKAYRLRVVLLTIDGAGVNERTLDVTPEDGTPVRATARVPAGSDVTAVRVELVGHPQTLLFRFGRAEDPNSAGKQ